MSTTPADVVPHLLGRRVEVQRVDGEVAACGVLGLRAVDVVGQQAAVLVGRVRGVLRRAERRHFEDVGADVDVHQAEAAADDVGAAEERLDLLRRRVGRDVEVLGREAEHEVAHGAADHERLEARLVQLLDHGARAARDLLAPTG
jgi:hypothetical protein